MPRIATMASTFFCSRSVKSAMRLRSRDLVAAYIFLPQDFIQRRTNNPPANNGPLLTL